LAGGLGEAAWRRCKLAVVTGEIRAASSLADRSSRVLLVERREDRR
jgi:hypothetical protein